jgi:hypothetical protein
MQKQTQVFGSLADQKPAPSELFGEVTPVVHEFVAAEKLMLLEIPNDLLRKEPALMQSKWFDYRRLHPVMATQLFVKAYNRAYGNFLATTTDVGLKYLPAFKGRDLLADKHRERKTVWKLRQLADEHGVPYDVFMNAAMRFYQREGWMHVPRPSHILSNELALLHVLDTWQNTKRDMPVWASLSFYTVDEWTGHPDQLAYEEHLLQFIRARAVKSYIVHQAVYLRRALRFERALQECDLGTLETALTLAAQD